MQKLFFTGLICVSQSQTTDGGATGSGSSLRIHRVLCSCRCRDERKHARLPLSGKSYSFEEVRLELTPVLSLASVTPSSNRTSFRQKPCSLGVDAAGSLTQRHKSFSGDAVRPLSKHRPASVQCGANGVAKDPGSERPTYALERGFVLRTNAYKCTLHRA